MAYTHSNFQIIAALTAAAITCTAPCVGAEEGCPQAKCCAPKGSFSITNKQFRANYADAKEEIGKNLGPMIIVRGGTMKLVKDGKDIESKSFIKAPYTQLKEVAHITLGTYVILVNHTGDEKLSKGTRAKLTEFRKAIAAAAPTIDKLDISDSQKENQKTLVSKTENFIDSVLKNNKVSREELRSFTRSIAKITLKNVDGAAASQITAMDKIIRGWAKGMTEDELAKLHVLIASTHMPRIRLSTLQFFLKLLKQKQPGEKVIISEGIDTDEKAVDLLLTHLLDENVAIDFYADKWRMHRDLLSDGIAKYLRKHPPEKLTAGVSSKTE